MTKIAITGASGKLGRRIATSLLEKISPDNLILISRNPAKLGDFAAMGVETRNGDFDQPESLESAFKNVDKLMIISTLSVGRRYEQHQRAINAAIACGVKHIVYTSSGGTSPDNPAIIARDHYLTEEALKACGLNYTIMRDSLYAEAIGCDIAPRAYASGVWAAPSGDGKLSPIAKDDCADVAVEILFSDEHKNKTYELTGPQMISMRDAAQILEELTGKKIEFRQISLEELDTALEKIGVPEDYIENMFTPGVGTSSRRDIITYEQGIKEGHFAVFSHDVENILGRKPQSIREIFIKNLAAVKELEK